MNNRNYNTETEIRSINSRLIISEPAYQRVLDYNRVKRIVTYFNQNLVNPIKISNRDGKYYVFDGQHTLAALKLRNNNHDLMVECKIYYGLTQQEEARLFAEQNGLSRTVESNARMKALFVAGDVEIIELHTLVTSLGIKLDFTKGNASNKIVAAKSAYDIFKKSTPSEFVQILKIIKESWGGEADSFRREILNGVAVFYLTNKSDINIKRAVTKFSKVSPIVIIREGKAYSDGGNKRFARQLVNIYNKKLSNGRLPDII